MATKILTIVACLLASPAFANMPPPKYDKPYLGKMEKHLVPYGFAAKKCRALDPSNHYDTMVSGRKLFGCQFWRAETCVIVYSYDPSGNDKAMQSNVYRHERGHCNGWVH